MSKFVSDATVEITLADGDHVWVKERLNAAENALLARHLMHVGFDAKTGVMAITEGDWHRNRIEIVKAYVTAWDFKNDAQAVVEYAPPLVDMLDPAVVVEIAEAIDGLQAARQENAEKKGKKR